MSDYLKTECPHCGQSVEYPSEGTGSWVECPTCGKSFALLPVGIAIPREPQRSDTKYDAWDDPAGRDYGYSLDHMRWAAEVKHRAERAQQFSQVEAELARAKQAEMAKLERTKTEVTIQQAGEATSEQKDPSRLNGDWRDNPATEKQKEQLRSLGCVFDPGITAGIAKLLLQQQNTHNPAQIRPPSAEVARQPAAILPSAKPQEAKTQANTYGEGLCKCCGKSGVRLSLRPSGVGFRSYCVDCEAKVQTLVFDQQKDRWVHRQNKEPVKGATIQDMDAVSKTQPKKEHGAHNAQPAPTQEQPAYKLPDAYLAALAAAGRKGGAAKGAKKRRGGAEHYQRLAALGAEARREKAKETADKLAMLETLLANEGNSSLHEDKRMVQPEADCDADFQARVDCSVAAIEHREKQTDQALVSPDETTPILTTGNEARADNRAFLERHNQGGEILPQNRSSDIAAQRLETLLTDLKTSGNYNLPVAEAAKCLDIDSESKLGISECREIAALLESIEYCVEPDARFTGCSYVWSQSLIIFKRIPGDRVEPSQAYIGAANLLRLCLLIAAADGRVDEEELDVFRQVIENQLDLSQTDHCRLSMLEKLLVAEPSPSSVTLSKIAKSVPPHKKLLIARVLMRVAAADRIIRKTEQQALDRIFRALDIPNETLELLLNETPAALEDNVGQEMQQTLYGAQTQDKPHKPAPNNEHYAMYCPDCEGQFEVRKSCVGNKQPCPLCQSIIVPYFFAKKPPRKNDTESQMPLGSQVKPRVDANARQTTSFAINMRRVETIAKETREVVGILSSILGDEQTEATPPATIATASVSSSKEQMVRNEGKATGVMFDGLATVLCPILERLITRSSWSQPDFEALANEFHLMPLMVYDNINEWADDALGDFLLEGEDPVVIHQDLIKKRTS